MKSLKSSTILSTMVGRMVVAFREKRKQRTLRYPLCQGKKYSVYRLIRWHFARRFSLLMTMRTIFRFYNDFLDWTVLPHTCTIRTCMRKDSTWTDSTRSHSPSNIICDFFKIKRPTLQLGLPTRAWARRYFGRIYRVGTRVLRF